MSRIRSNAPRPKSASAVYRKAWPLVLLSASSLLAACGGHARQTTPHIPKTDAAQLIALAQTVAKDSGGDGCATRTQIDALGAKAHELVAAGRVPLRLRAPLLDGITALAADAPTCTPPPAPVNQPRPGKHGKPPKEHHGHGHGHDGGD